jgi:hypothetical protein
MMGGCRPPAVTTAAGADRSMEIAGGAITKRRREQGSHEYMRVFHHGVLRGRTTCEMKLRKKMVMGRPNLLSQSTFLLECCHVSKSQRETSF